MNCIEEMRKRLPFTNMYGLLYVYMYIHNYPTEKSYKYARRGAISAVYIVIMPGIINYEKNHNYYTCIFLDNYTFTFLYKVSIIYEFRFKFYSY